jgi:hypothetical protein
MDRANVERRHRRDSPYAARERGRRAQSRAYNKDWSAFER